MISVASIETTNSKRVFFFLILSRAIFKIDTRHYNMPMLIYKIA